MFAARSGFMTAGGRIKELTLTSTIAITGSSPHHVAVSPNGSKLYTSNTNSDNVSVIDTATNTETSTITVGDGPRHAVVSPDNSKLYVSNNTAGTVSVINTSTNTVTATIGLGSTSSPRISAIKPDGTRLYVTKQGSGNVAVIDTSTNTVTATVTTGSYPQGVAVSPDGSKAYVTNWGGGSVSVITTSTNSVANNVRPDPRLGILNSDGSVLYYASTGTSFYAVDTSTFSIDGPYNFTAGTSTVALALSPDDSTLYVVGNTSNNLLLVDTATKSVIKTFTTSNPYGVSVSPDGSKVYVANYSDNTVSVFTYI